MTDFSETRIVRSHALSEARNLFASAIITVQELGLTLIAGVKRRPSGEKARLRAERLQLAKTLRDDARRNVDKLMM